MNWKYKDIDVKSHADLHSNCTDFVYKLVFSDNTIYYGKKTVRSIAILPAQKNVRVGAERINRHILRDGAGNILSSKKDKARGRRLGLKAKREEFDKILTDKPFVKYNGSSKENEGKVLVSKEILYQSSSKITATYLELALIIKNDALTSDKYNNENALGKFYGNCLDGLIKD